MSKERINNAIEKVLAKDYNQAAHDLNNTINDKLAERLEQERVAISSRIYGNGAEETSTADEE